MQPGKKAGTKTASLSNPCHLASTGQKPAKQNKWQAECPQNEMQLVNNQYRIIHTACRPFTSVHNLSTHVHKI
jgi:hypothetical protein